MRVSRSKSGLPTITENGGSATNTGSCTIVCGKNGKPVKPLFIPRGYSNQDHAIFVARVGMFLVDARRDRSGESVTFRRITAIGTPGEPDELVAEMAWEYENGDGNVPAAYQDTVAAALEKVHCYHCRCAHYVAERV